MPFINGLLVDDDTGLAVVTEDAPAGGDSYRTGLRYADDGTLFVLTGAVPGTATFQDGWARSSTGQLCVLIDTPPSAPNRFYNDGILCDADGHVCLTTNAIAGYIHGWPVDSIGQICITGGTPPPPTTTIDTVTIHSFTEAALTWITNLYFGDSGGIEGHYINKASFLSDNPGLTLQDFSGIAPPAGRVTPVPTFAGFTPSCNAGPTLLFVEDTLYVPFGIIHSVSPDLAGSAVMTLVFDPPVSAVGFNIAQSGNAFQIMRTDFYHGGTGGTLLSSTEYVNPGYIDTFTTFSGYSTGTVPTGDFYQQESNSDVYIQESSGSYIQE